jgi:hypothetical protein
MLDIDFAGPMAIAVCAGVREIFEIRISKVGDRWWIAILWLCCEDFTGATARKDSAFAKGVG